MPDALTAPITLQAAVEALQQAHSQERYAHVAHRCRALLAQHPHEPVLWKLLGAACHELGDFKAARHAWQQGLSLAPDDAGLWGNLANTCSRLGDVETAVAAYHRTLALNPNDMQACLGLTLLDCKQLGPDHLGAMQRCATDPAQSNKQRRSAWYALGAVHADRFDDTQAFVCYQQANALVLQEAPAVSPFWSEKAYSVMGPAFMTRYRRESATNHEAPHPLIITGLPRSGKSLVERLLSTHACVQAGGERAGLVKYLERTAASLGQAPSLAALAQAVLNDPRPAWDSISEAQAEHLNGAASTARWLTDTSPGNLGVLGLLPSIDPQVPVILCERDPLDLACACYFKSFKRLHAYTSDMPMLGRTIALAEQLMDLWAQRLPNPILRVRYEALVRAPQTVAEQLATLLGLPAAELIAAVKRLQASPGFAAPLHPAHSPAQGAISDALVGVGQRFVQHMAPMLDAYQTQKTKVLQ